jgi:small subunit ribosomal protein S1
MSTDLQRHDLKPPPPQLDEGYWAALLAEGEHAQNFLTEGDISEPRTDIDEFVGSDEHFYTTTRDVSDEDWVEIQRIASADEVVELKVVGYNRGGLLAEWRSLRGFVPASQLVDFPSTSNSPVRRDALIQRVGQSLLLRVIELSADKNRLILSERAAQAEPGQRADILSALKAGDIVTGIVTNLCDFGAFVDLGGLEGLIHISELSWGRVGHPDSLLKRGEQINAYVLGVDRDSARIALSVKRLRPDPWQTVEQRYQSGEIVEGVITNVVDFGAFACIEEGLEGLIHVSELAEGHFLHPRNVVSEGQHVRARIIAISGPERRLGLSLRLNTE